MVEVEIKRIKTKYESFRLKDKVKEKYLLASILKNGVKKPLSCVNQDRDYILLDGFKRLRCCYKLKIFYVPVSTVGIDEAASILHIIRQSNEKTLTIVEQARFVDELKKSFGLGVSEIAKRLEVSRAWVSVRTGILGEMSDCIKQEVFSGRFPLRSYMYTLRQFTRVNKIPKQTVDRFVKAVSGKSLSQRNIEKLAYGYFRGNEQLRKQIEKGNLGWTLKQMNGETGLSYTHEPELTREESDFIRDLELCQKYMTRVRKSLPDKRKGSKVFEKTVKLLLDSIGEIIEALRKEIRRYYDCRKHS
jgi:ParB/RepB/Spo0J family partition protein